MAYDEYQVERISNCLQEKRIVYQTKKMFGGMLFMVNDKMFCGMHFDKKKQTDLLMARIGESASLEALKRKGCHPMDFTGRPMKGYVFVTPEGYDTEDDLAYWIDLCFQYNPLAKASKKKKKKINLD